MNDVPSQENAADDYRDHLPATRKRCPDCHLLPHGPDQVRCRSFINCGARIGSRPRKVSGVRKSEGGTLDSAVPANDGAVRSET